MSSAPPTTTRSDFWLSATCGPNLKGAAAKGRVAAVGVRAGEDDRRAARARQGQPDRPAGVAVLDGADKS